MEVEEGCERSEESQWISWIPAPGQGFILVPGQEFFTFAAASFEKGDLDIEALLLSKEKST